MPETNSLHIAGLILARGGSQGIPLKNIAPLGSHPLLMWSLGAMKAFQRFDSIWVSTDHSSIAKCASAMGVSVFHRSPEFARCGTPSVDAVQEFLQNHPEVDIVGLVQCTSPFLQPEYLSKAYKLMTEEGYESVFSVTRDKKLRWSEDDFDIKSEDYYLSSNQSNFEESNSSTLPLKDDINSSETNCVMQGRGREGITCAEYSCSHLPTSTSPGIGGGGEMAENHSAAHATPTSEFNPDHMELTSTHQEEKVPNGNISFNHRILSPPPAYTTNGSCQNGVRETVSNNCYHKNKADGDNKKIHTNYYYSSTSCSR